MHMKDARVITEMEDIVECTKNIGRNQDIVPIIQISNKTCSGMTVLLNFLNQLPTHVDLPLDEN